MLVLTFQDLTYVLHSQDATAVPHSVFLHHPGAGAIASPADPAPGRLAGAVAA